MTFKFRYFLAVTLFVGVFFAACLSQTQGETTQILDLRTFVAPAYPALARMSRVQGKADADIHINANGTIASLAVKSHPLFQRYVEKALEQWRFESLTEPATLHVVVNFEIETCPHAKLGALGEAQVRETRVSAVLPGTVTVGTCTDFVTTTTSDPVSR